MNPNAFLRPALALSVCVLAASHASGQCLDWAEGLRASGMNGLVSDLAFFDDGAGPTLYAGGSFSRASGAAVSYLARWNGSRWEALAASPDSPVNELEVRQESGAEALYVGGDFLHVGSVSSPSIARFDGVSWTGFGLGLNGWVNEIEFFDAGDGPRMYAGGFFSSSGTVAMPSIAQWTGSSWVSIGGATAVGGASVMALQAFDDGTGPALYVGGDFSYVGGNQYPSLARWNGSSWSPVGSFNSSVVTLGVYDGGGGPELVAGGPFTLINGSSAPGVARWNGSVWTAFGTGIGGVPIGNVVTLAMIERDGPDELYVGGNFTAAGGSPAQNVARWNGAAWSALAGGTDGQVRTLLPSIGGTGTELYAGGAFAVVGGAYSGGVAKWDGAAWSVVDHGSAPVGGSIHALASYVEGLGERLFAGGDFRYAGTVLASGIARWDGASWSEVGGGTPGAVQALAVYDDGTGPWLYAGGAFATMGSAAGEGIARWNGSEWRPLVSTPEVVFYSNRQVRALTVFDDGSGPALYVAGIFSTVDGTIRGIVRWKDSTWTPVGAGLYPGALSLAVHDDGSGPALFAGGEIESSGPDAIARIAKWTGSLWTNLGTGISGTPPWANDVLALASHDDGTGPALYAGGLFNDAGGITVSNLARWRDGAWSEFGGGTVGAVRALPSLDDGDGDGAHLFIGGEIVQVGSTFVNRITKWDGASFDVMDAGLTAGIGTAAVRALCAWDDGGGRDVYAGGRFEFASGSNVSTNIARWEGCGETGETFCYGDGSATACPCGNASAAGERAGCAHSLGTGGALRGRGESSLADDSLVLDGAAMPNSSALYFQAANVSNGGQGVVFGDGVKCTNGPFVRLGTKVNVAGASVYPESGDPAVSVKGLITAPGVRRYQVRYRNSADFCTPDTFNYTNGLEVIWRP